MTPYLVNFLAVNIFYWIVRFENWWQFFGFRPMTPDFADLRAYTSAVSCSQQGINYLVENCDPWGRKIGLLNIYVPILKFFNFNEDYTSLIGNSMQVLLFLTVFLLAYVLHINLGKLRNCILIFILLVSPPIALLVAQGQLEIILFVSDHDFCDSYL